MLRSYLTFCYVLIGVEAAINHLLVTFRPNYVHKLLDNVSEKAI